MYEDIIQLLKEKKLKEAWEQIKETARTLGDWKLQSEIETQQTTYDYMLRYTALGTQDPEREAIYNELLCKAYELADKVCLLKEQEKAYGYFADKLRLFSQNPPHTFKEIGFLLEAACHTPTDPQTEEEEAQVLQDYTRHQHTLDELFNKIWVSAQWSEEEYREACELLASSSMSVNDRAVMMSAITLSLLRIFDSRKFQMLLSACREVTDPAVAQRALVGIALTTYFQSERITFYPELTAALKLMKEDSSLLRQLHDIQMIFLLSRETEKIDKKMREEIIPQMMRNPKLKNQELKAIETDDIEDANPEWKQGLEKIQNQIQELGELQMEGADTYMTAFSQLKSFPFFHEAAHWFYLFSTKVPDLYRIYKGQAFTEKSLLGLMTRSSMFCDSDKYSFCLAMQSLPTDQQTFMRSKLSGEELIPMEPEGQPEEKETAILQRQYIHNLYRFCKLWKFRQENHDLFCDKLDFWNTPLLRPLILTGEYHERIAGYLFSKGYMEEAAALYKILAAQNRLDADIWQKLGFAFQKNKEYENAIKAYLEAYVLKPKHAWTVKQLALCHKLAGNYAQAVSCFRRVLEVDPDNPYILMQTGQCLAALKNYTEAIQLFYKVEYLEPNHEKACRAIAWCHFLSGNDQEALRMYDKLLAMEQPQANDQLNAGHVCLVQGNIPQALCHYRKAAEACESADAFVNLFLADKDTLTGRGISECQIYLMADILRQPEQD